MITKIGVASWICAGVIVIFKMITGIMGKEMFWTHFTLSTVLGDATDSVVQAFPAGWFQANMDKLMYDIEIYILLIGLGVLMFIIGAFKKA